MDMGFPFGVTKRFGTRQKWWLPNIVNVLNANDLYTLKWLISCHVNCISLKMNKQTRLKIFFSLYCVLINLSSLIH